jgi:uncharacterized protein YjbI with pentapeptide repeats
MSWRTLGISLVFLAIAASVRVRADIYRWDNGQLIPGTEGITPGPGVQFLWNDLSFADFRSMNLSGTVFFKAILSDAKFDGAIIRGASFANALTAEQLYSTQSYKSGDLSRISLGHIFGYSDRNYWDFHAQNLTGAGLIYASFVGADFSGAKLDMANFTGADFTGAHFDDASINGVLGLNIFESQLRTTASYQRKDLSGIDFPGDLSGWDLSGQRLAFATLGTTVGTNFSLADLRGASLNGPDLNAVYRSTIDQDGRIWGLHLTNADDLWIRDYDGSTPAFPAIAIKVLQGATIAPNAMVKIILESDDWDSLISFEPGIPVQLGGELALTFTNDVDVSTQVGRTIRIFDWTGVSPTGQFHIASPYAWDLSRLYTSGEITLLAVPEPSTLSLTLLVVLSLARRIRQHLSSRQGFQLGDISMVKPEKVVAMLLLIFCSSTAQADVTVSVGLGANQFTIEFATIGNPGNPADTTGSPNPAGSVGYVFNIGKYEISRDAIEKANAEVGLGITLDPMDFVTGGPRPAMPATGVSWNEAARFVNFLNTSQGFHPAYKFSTQPGDVHYDSNANIELWLAGDPGYDANNRFRNSLTHYFLPSVHEWYKAAYYDPNANSGVGGYWDYPTGSDLEPTPVSSGTEDGTAVFSQHDVLDEFGFFLGPADITQAGGLSPYGVMGLGGNAYEWQETAWNLMNDDGASQRVVRGGGWAFEGSWLSALSFGTPGPGFSLLPYYEGWGFRIASVPEPASVVLGISALVGLLIRRRVRPTGYPHSTYRALAFVVVVGLLRLGVAQAEPIYDVYGTDANAGHREFATSVASENGYLVVGGRGGDGRTAGDNHAISYAFNAETGELLHRWDSEVPLSELPPGAWSGPRPYFLSSHVATNGSRAVVHQQYRRCYNILPYCYDFGGDVLDIFDLNSGTLLNRVEPSSSPIVWDENSALTWQYDIPRSTIGVDGDLAVVGVPNDGSYHGAAYVVDISDGNVLRKLVPSDSVAGDHFGFSVSVSDGVALIGSPVNQFVYAFDIRSGAQLTQIPLPEELGVAEFGVRLALSGDRAVVMASYSTGGPGITYGFDARTGTPVYSIPASFGSPDFDLLRFPITDGKLLLTGDVDANNALMFFDLETGQPVGTQLFRDEIEFSGGLLQLMALDSERLYLYDNESPCGSIGPRDCDGAHGRLYAFPRSVPEPSGVTLMAMTIILFAARCRSRQTNRHDHRRFEGHPAAGPLPRHKSVHVKPIAPLHN